MGYPIYREVKKWAPDTLTHREKLAAMVLADDANDDTRVTFSSVVDPEILRQAMIKNDRDMRKILTRLVEEKVIERVAIGGNGRAAKYRFRHLASEATTTVAGPNQTGNNPAEPDVAGPEKTSNSGVAGPEKTGNPGSASEVAGPEKTSYSGVAGPKNASCRSNLDLPTPSTSSTTTSSPVTDATDAAGDQSPDASSSTTEAPKRKPRNKAASKPNQHQVADDLTAAFWEARGKGRAQSFIAVRGVVRTAIGNGVDRDDCARALERVVLDGYSISGATVDIALGKIRNARGPYRNPNDQDDYDQPLIQDADDQSQWDEDL